MAKKSPLSPLAASVKQDIQAFLSGRTRPFTCEADFQLSLAEYLRGTGKYQNDNRYAVWKDIKRIEWIKSHSQYSKTVKNGFVVFISNDPAYQRLAKGYSTANCKNAKPVEYHSRKPALGISGGYDIDWQPIPGITIGGTQPCGADPQPCVNGEKANPGFSYIIIEA